MGVWFWTRSVLFAFVVWVDCLCCVMVVCWGNFGFWICWRVGIIQFFRFCCLCLMVCFWCDLSWFTFVVWLWGLGLIVGCIVLRCIFGFVFVWIVLCCLIFGLFIVGLDICFSYFDSFVVWVNWTCLYLCFDLFLFTGF